MRNVYLLYVDFLGFADLVQTSPAKVDDLFRIVASLNLHHHDGFCAVAFSDTLVVHNAADPVSEHDHRYVVMYQCEFFRDLLYRLAGRGISVRGLLTYGPFEHYHLNDVPYYYGPSLIYAYRQEKDLKITGLLMDNHCRERCAVFGTSPFGDLWHYVFVTQALDAFEDLYEAQIPLSKDIVDDAGLGWSLGPELETVAYSVAQQTAHPQPEVRVKHAATVAQYRSRYPRVFAALEPAAFRMEAVSPFFDWSSVRARMRDGFDWGSVKRPPRVGGTFGRPVA